MFVADGIGDSCGAADDENANDEGVFVGTYKYSDRKRSK